MPTNTTSALSMFHEKDLHVTREIDHECGLGMVRGIRFEKEHRLTQIKAVVLGAAWSRLIDHGRCFSPAIHADDDTVRSGEL